jgi:hypothetical protein
MIRQRLCGVLLMLQFTSQDLGFKGNRDTEFVLEDSTSVGTRMQPNFHEDEGEGR